MFWSSKPVGAGLESKITLSPVSKPWSTIVIVFWEVLTPAVVKPRGLNTNLLL